jgi:predicted ATP-dependent endonuclease of OLD family
VINDTTNFESALRSGYLMAEAIHIRNFRGFAEVDLPDCRRVNVIVGANGSGKTALMEAVFLAIANSPEPVMRMRGWRGFDANIGSQHPRVLYRSIWGDLFHNYDFSKKVTIGLQGSRLHTREVSIIWNDRNIRITHSTRSQEAAYSPVQFVWTGHNKRTISSSIPKLINGQISYDAAPMGQLDGVFFPANQTYSSSETASRFSELSKQEKEREVIEYFKSQFGVIESLSLELQGINPMVFAKITDLNEKLPISLISGGMNKLASILFTFPIYPQGIVIIDEIENGFYYKILPTVWKAILDLANEYDVQVFATTHSLECIRAAASVAAANPEGFSLLRAVHDGPNGSIIRQFTGKDFASAVEDDIELR